MLAGKDGALDGTIAEVLLSTPDVSIEGGTDGIQLNIVAKRVLLMPKEAAADADHPIPQRGA
jgi:hypothetical protein